MTGSGTIRRYEGKEEKDWQGTSKGLDQVDVRPGKEQP